MRFPPSFVVDINLKQIPLEKDPAKWDRPKWFGSNYSSDYMRKVIWQETPQEYEDNPFGGVDSYIRCPVCSQKCAFMGADIDHNTPWRAYVAMHKAQTYYDLYCCYHDLDNLVLLHAGCNSHKKKNLTETLTKSHTPKQTATWNRTPEVVNFHLVVSKLYQQEDISLENRLYIENKIVKRFQAGGWHRNNAYGSLIKFFGDGAVKKAIDSLTL